MITRLKFRYGADMGSNTSTQTISLWNDETSLFKVNRADFERWLARKGIEVLRVPHDEFPVYNEKCIDVTDTQCIELKFGIFT